eukprot:6341349-Karenia_brevis.AAC.1
MEARTLDIKEIQVLRHYEDDAGGFYWHHRILLARAGEAGRWVALTPDFGLEILDLGVTRHIILGRASAFPAAQLPYVYAFDPISRAELEQQRVRARLQARVLAADDDEDEVEASIWVTTGPGREKVGLEVAQEVIDDAEKFRDLGNRAVAEVDGEVLFCERIAAAKKE